MGNIGIGTSLNCKGISLQMPNKRFCYLFEGFPFFERFLPKIKSKTFKFKSYPPSICIVISGEQYVLCRCGIKQHRQLMVVNVKQTPSRAGPEPTAVTHYYRHPLPQDKWLELFCTLTAASTLDSLFRVLVPLLMRLKRTSTRVVAEKKGEWRGHHLIYESTFLLGCCADDGSSDINLKHHQHYQQHPPKNA